MQKTHPIHPDLYEGKHWCCHSEPFVGVDALLSMLDRGWRIAHNMCVVRSNDANSRMPDYFEFELVKGSQRSLMTVIQNPRLHTLLQAHGVIVIDDRTQVVQPVILRTKESVLR
jgi:hypothetical protein